MQVVLPFVVLNVAYFVSCRKISFVMMGAAFFSLYFAYQIVEPLRAYIGKNQIAGAMSVEMAIETLQNSRSMKDEVYLNSLPWGTQVVSRFDLTGMTAVGLSLDSMQSSVIEVRENMAKALYLAVPYAWIPRFLWPNKPINSTGVWFNQVALGQVNDVSTAVAMGPVAWFYILGGVGAVIIGFFLIGAFQAFMFDGFARSGVGGIIIFLSTLMVISTIPSDIAPALIGLIRQIPLAFIAQLVFLRAVKRKGYVQR